MSTNEASEIISVTEQEAPPNRRAASAALWEAITKLPPGRSLRVVTAPDAMARVRMQVMGRVVRARRVPGGPMDHVFTRSIDPQTFLVVNGAPADDVETVDVG